MAVKSKSAARDKRHGRLRKKIDAEGESPLIHTVRGAGYRLGARE